MAKKRSARISKAATAALSGYAERRYGLSANRKRARVKSLKAVALVGGVLVGGFTAYKLFGGKATAGTGSAQSPIRLPAASAAAKSTRQSKRPAAAAAPASSVLLQQGQTSAQVQQLQEALIQSGGQPAQEIIASGGADGTYGTGTVRALKAAGIRNPAQLTSAGYQAVLKKAAVTVGAKKTVASTIRQVAPTLPAVPALRPAQMKVAAPALQRDTVTVAQGKRPAKRPATTAKRSAASKLTLRQTLMRSSLLTAIAARDFQSVTSTLAQVQSLADWGKIGTPSKFSDDTAPVKLTAKMLAVFPYAMQQRVLKGQFAKIAATP